MKIKFKRDTAFRKQFFVPDSFSHPAKMDAQLLLWIVNRYTKAGETILDPMAGSGTTMLACTLGRNVVLVELEEKFCKMMRDNWEQVKMRPQLGSTMGTCEIIQGDARQLEGLVDKIVTSPPYAESDLNVKPVTDKYPELKGKGGGLLTGLYKGHGDNPNNIGNLPYGQIDKIVTSPPYGNPRDIDEQTERDYEDERLGESDKQHGRTQFRGRYEVDSIITSPPYENAVHKQDESSFGDEELDKQKTNMFYGETKGNIGNLKSDSYLEAMLQVYQQCYKVLRDKGLMILVTKNFIRNKKVVRLDTDTIKLCEQAGFSFVERHYRKLPSQSFWRVIYHKKFPDVEQINNEDVLVFKKLHQKSDTN